MPEDGKQWTLSIGCHRKTLTSRDSTKKKYDSLEECRQAVQKLEKFYRSIGYFVWFANATGPNGEKVKLHEGTPYMSVSLPA